MDHPYSIYLTLIALMCSAGHSLTAEEVRIARFPRVEWVPFKLLHEQAGTPDPRRVQNVSNLEETTFKMSDGVAIGGYKLKSTKAAESRNCLLVVPGDAQLCDTLVKHLTSLQSLSLDIFVLDHRGYGKSPGQSSLEAIINDYRQILSQLPERGYSHRFGYGISFGGFVLLNASGNSKSLAKLIVDSTPASVVGVRTPFQPIALLPDDCRNLFLISGGVDAKVPPKRMEPLLALAKRRGAGILAIPDIGHPFDPQRPQSDSRTRVAAIKTFLEANIE